MISEELLQELREASIANFQKIVNEFMDENKVIEFDDFKKIIITLLTRSNYDDEVSEGWIVLSDLCTKFIANYQDNKKEITLSNLIELINWFDRCSKKDEFGGELINQYLKYPIQDKIDRLCEIREKLDWRFSLKPLISTLQESICKKNLNKQEALEFARRMKFDARETVIILAEALKNSATIIDRKSIYEWLSVHDHSGYAFIKDVMEKLPHNRFAGDFYIELWQQSVATHSWVPNVMRSGIGVLESRDIRFASMNILPFLTTTKEPLKLTWFIENVLSFIKEENFGEEYKKIITDHARAFFRNPVSDYGPNGLEGGFNVVC